MSQNSIRPKLVVSDAAAAIEFYRETLGATLVSTYPVGDSIVFAELEIMGCTVTLKDADDTDPAPTTPILRRRPRPLGRSSMSSWTIRMRWPPR